MPEDQPMIPNFPCEFGRQIFRVCSVAQFERWQVVKSQLKSRSQLERENQMPREKLEARDHKQVANCVVRRFKTVLRLFKQLILYVCSMLLAGAE